MEIKYGSIVDNSAISSNIQRLINQTYKLLPNREEGLDWKKPLETILEEFSGMDSLFLKKQETLFSLLCKLEGLLKLDKEEDFQLYRRTIFECLSLMNQLKQDVNRNA